MRTDGRVPPPEFLLQWIWIRIAFLTSSLVMLGPHFENRRSRIALCIQNVAVLCSKLKVRLCLLKAQLGENSTCRLTQQTYCCFEY